MDFSLLEAMQGWANCTYLSDLHCLDCDQKARLRKAVTNVLPEAGTLEEWNVALTYIADVPEERTPAAAKEALITFLSR